MVVQFLLVLRDYVIEVVPFLAVGFFLSGLIHEFVPTEWVERHLGGKGIKPLFYSTFVGTALPKRGRYILNVVPFPGSLSTVIEPSCALTIP